MRKNKIRTGLFALFGAIMVSGLGISSMAAWSVASSTWNYVSTPSYGSDLVEDWTSPEEGVSPGREITKQVTVRNTGDIDELVRIRLERKLGKLKDGILVEDPQLDPKQIVLNLNEKDWMLDDSDPEGWYYYKQPLCAQEETTPLLYSFHLHPDCGNAYQDCDAQIIVSMETVQYGKNGVAAWGKTYADLGIAEPSDSTEATDTQIRFLGPDKKFDIDVLKTDLFANFKGLLPGSVRSQKIILANDHTESTTMSLTAMDIREDKDNQMLSDLMLKYITAEIKDSKGTVLYEGPVGGNGKCDIPFGSFEPKSQKEITVTIKVSEDLTEEYQGLLGRVEWQVNADEVSKPLNRLVQTGDDGFWIYFGCGLLFAGLIGLYIVKKYGKAGDMGCGN